MTLMPHARASAAQANQKILCILSSTYPEACRPARARAAAVLPRSQGVTMNVTFRFVISSPSWAWHRTTYVPGSWKLACTTHLLSFGMGGSLYPVAHGDPAR